MTAAGMPVIGPVRPRPWAADAACAGSDTRRWFPDLYQSPTAEVVAICRACPVRVPCLVWALRNNERHGVWGGYTARQRIEFMRRRRRVA